MALDPMRPYRQGWLVSAEFRPLQDPGPTYEDGYAIHSQPPLVVCGGCGCAIENSQGARAQHVLWHHTVETTYLKAQFTYTVIGRPEA